MTRIQTVLVVAAAVVATSVSCSGGEPEGVDPEFAQRLDRDLERAQEAGASTEQLAILREAQETGEISFDVYNEAIDAALRCARESGVAVHDGGTFDHLGLTIRNYSVPYGDADQREPLPSITVHRCVAEHSFWVERLYQLQPASLEAQEAHFEQFRDAIVECLAGYGIEVAADLSHRELSSQFRGGPDDEDAQIYGRCLDETGYSRS